MKSRKKRYSSSSASAESGDSEESSEASQSAESGESDSGSQRARRRKRRADSTDSESEDEDARKKAKKRKHKKKKKKHGKKRKRDRSASEEEASSESEGERKKKHKHKHSHKHKRERSASPSVEEVPVREERIEDRARSRLQSVVKERHQSGGVSSHHRSASPPQERHHRYYHQKEYERSASVSEGDYEERRRDDVDKFYRGSSKDRSVREGDRGRAGRDERYQREQRYEGGDRYTERYTGHEYSNNKGPEEYPHTRRPRDYDEYNNRTSKYDDRGGGKFEEEYTRGEPHFRERRDNREFNPRYQHEDRLEKKPYDKGPLCLVCGETHIGQQCRRRLPERPRERDYGASRDYGGTRDYRPDKYEPKRVPEKRERERDRPEREERARPSGEHRERSRQRSPHKAASRERKSPPRRISPSRGEAVRGEGERGGGERGRSRERARDKKGEEEKVPEKRERPPREGDRETRRPSRDRRDKKSRFNAEEGKSYSWGKTEVKKEEAPADKDKPDFGLSGKLAADTNMVNGILLKYNEPKDAKQPKRRWRFYPFKGDKALPILYIHRQSCFVLGRDHKAVDIPLEHPSVSKQHAALQYRATPYTRPDGTQARRVRPYIIDLDSANGTFVNNKKVEARRFVELLERDVVKFGFSQREYVLLHENSKDDAADDDQEMNGTGGEGGDGGELGEGVTSIAAVKREKQIKHESREDGE